MFTIIIEPEHRKAFRMNTPMSQEGSANAPINLITPASTPSIWNTALQLLEMSDSPLVTPDFMTTRMAAPAVKRGMGLTPRQLDFDLDEDEDELHHKSEVPHEALRTKVEMAMEDHLTHLDRWVKGNDRKVPSNLETVHLHVTVKSKWDEAGWLKEMKFTF